MLYELRKPDQANKGDRSCVRDALIPTFAVKAQIAKEQAPTRSE